MAFLAEVLLHFRTLEKAAILDLNKAYQSIRMTEKELHLRRFLCRQFPEEPWRDYGYARATFWDKAAALLLLEHRRKSTSIQWQQSSSGTSFMWTMVWLVAGLRISGE